jgi:hypothetical protein
LNKHHPRDYDHAEGIVPKAALSLLEVSTATQNSSSAQNKTVDPTEQREESAHHLLLEQWQNQWQLWESGGDEWHEMQAQQQMKLMQRHDKDHYHWRQDRELVEDTKVPKQVDEHSQEDIELLQQQQRVQEQLAAQEQEAVQSKLNAMASAAMRGGWLQFDLGFM